MIFIFVIDTSTSMSARAHNFLSLLDCAKSAVENFVHLRSQDPSLAKSDRYVLITSESGPGAIKCGVRGDNLPQFQAELKNLRPFDLTDLGGALSKAAQLINGPREKLLDNFSMGRLPWQYEPANVYLFTDGGVWNDQFGIVPGATLPQVPQYSLVRDHFRWDQRIFSFVLRMGLSQAASTNISSIGQLCESTGGRCSVIQHVKHLFQEIDRAVQRLPFVGVTLGFEPAPPLDRALPVGMTLPRPQRTLLYSRLGVPGAFPIPEDVFLTAQTTILPQRSGVPTIKFNPIPTPCPDHPGNFPADHYSLEQSDFTAWLIANIDSGAPEVDRNLRCYECFVLPSDMAGVATTHYPAAPYFGFLKPNVETNSVSLWVLPYNYQALFLFLNNWSASSRPDWREAFMRQYLSQVPIYYHYYLKQAMRKWTAPNFPGTGNPQMLIPDPLSYPIGSIPALVGQIEDSRKRAKQELASLEAAVSAYRESVSQASWRRRVTQLYSSGSKPVTQPPAFSASSNNSSTSGWTYTAPNSPMPFADTPAVLIPNGTRTGSGPTPPINPVSAGATPMSGTSPKFTDALTNNDRMYFKGTTIPRSIRDVPADKFEEFYYQLMDFAFGTSTSPTSVVVASSAVEESLPTVRAASPGARQQPKAQPKPAPLPPGKNNLPIAQMGNYQEYLKAQQKLRSITDADEKPAYFGNPFSSKKSSKIPGGFIDEADVGEFGAMQNVQSPSKPGKRKAVDQTPTPTSPAAPSPQQQKLQQTLSQQSSTPALQTNGGGAMTQSIVDKQAEARRKLPKTSETQDTVVAHTKQPTKLEPTTPSTSVNGDHLPLKAPAKVPATAPKQSPPVAGVKQPPVVAAATPKDSAPVSIKTEQKPQSLISPKSDAAADAPRPQMARLALHYENNLIKFGLVQLLRERRPIEADMAARLAQVKGDAVMKAKFLAEVRAMTKLFKKNVVLPDSL